MHRSFSKLLLTTACVLLASCGGGGGAPANTPEPIPFANIIVPAGFNFSNVKSKVVTPADVVNTTLKDAAVAAGVPDSKIHVQVWYLDISGVRQPLVVTTLKNFPSSITIQDIPAAVTELQAESYFWNTTLAATISTGILRIAL